MIKQTSMFGPCVDAEIPVAPTRGYKGIKAQRAYRKSDDKKIRCRTCKYCIQMEHHNKNYYKCELIGVSNSEATDIRLSYVCTRWEAENDV